LRFIRIYILSGFLSGMLIVSRASAQDSLAQFSDTLISRFDTVFVPASDVGSGLADSALKDTSVTDTSRTLKKKENVIEAPVHYVSQDSIMFDITDKRVFLYKNGVVNYQEIELKADYIEFGMADKLVFAAGIKDTAGVFTGTPVFKEKDEEFKSKEMTYNFQTKKGIIKEVITEQEGGYLHGDRVKRQANEQIHLRKGKYTTCEFEHPHFYLALSKAKVIPDDKIVAGPSYLVLEDVPLYFIGLPFGFFPNSKGSKSGVLIPEYGQEQRRGFFLKDGGYYFAISDYMDLSLTGAYYTNKTWGTNVNTRYVKRYRFNGEFTGNYFEDITSEKGLPDYMKQKDMAVVWRHDQDPKANPNSRFSANVNFSNTSYDKNQSYEVENYTTATKSSNISYFRSIPNSPFSFSSNLRHSQNRKTQRVDFKLPEFAFDMQRQFPFKSNKSTAKQRWSDDIQVGFNSKFENNVNTYDTILFDDFNRAMRMNDKGYMHTIPVSMNIKPISNFTITPNVTYDGVMYPEYIRKHYESYYDTAYQVQTGRVVTDTINDWVYGHSVKPGVSFTYNPKVYMMYQGINPDWKFVAVRHVMTPSASLSYLPDIRRFVPNYYDTVYRNNNPSEGIAEVYSRFDNRIYGTPSLNGKAANVALSLKNNVEMKLRNDKDTVNEFKKIAIFDRFDFSTNYNIYAKEFNWSNVNVDAGTRLFNNSIDLQAGAVYDLYDFDSVPGRPFSYFRRDTFYYDAKGKIAHLTSFRTSTNFSVGNGFFTRKTKSDITDTVQPEGETSVSTSDYDYFSIPWNLSIGYDFNYSKPYYKADIIQALTVSGQLSPTKNWRIAVTSGYDFKMKQITYTTFNIYRDLHCWEMSMQFSPFGIHKFYEFRINVKSAMLKDLKYEKKKNWRDYQSGF